MLVAILSYKISHLWREMILDGPQSICYFFNSAMSSAISVLYVGLDLDYTKLLRLELRFVAVGASGCSRRKTKFPHLWLLFAQW